MDERAVLLFHVGEEGLERATELFERSSSWQRLYRFRCQNIQAVLVKLGVEETFLAV